MPREPFLPTLRELVRCYQAFEVFSAAHVRTLDLTPPQFDIIATLGNTPGMTFKELGEKTLITKGTLTGVMNMVGNIGSFVSSVTFPYLLDITHSAKSYFFLAAFLNLAAVACWLRVRPGDARRRA